MSELLAPTVNLIILLSFLVYKLRKPLAEFVHQRHSTLRDELGHVDELLRQAQEKYDEFTAKLRAIETEATSLREQARQDGRTAKLKLLSEAQKASSQIVADAREAAAGLFSELKGQLYHEFGQKILERAESIMRDRLTGDDRARIRREFSAQVETAQ